MPDIVMLITAASVGILLLFGYRSVKQEREKIKEEILSKNKRIILGCQSVLTHAESNNLSSLVKLSLYKRIHEAYIEINNVSKSATTVEAMHSAEAEIESLKVNWDDTPSFDDLDIPKEQLLVIAKIKFIKKIRRFMMGEKIHNRISFNSHAKEDGDLYTAQLKLSVETYYNAAIGAKIKNQVGSARSYFEKCLKILDSSKISNSYVEEKRQSVKSELQEIKDKLANKQKEHLRKIKKEEENNEINQLFAPKRKW